MSTAPRLQFANYPESQPEFKPAPLEQPQEWTDQKVSKKPPRPVGQLTELFWEAARKGIPASHATKELDEIYVMGNRPVVVRFIEENRLHGLLAQARQPLTNAFSDRAVKMLSLERDEEGFETLFCLVLIAGPMEPARQALRRFDQDWWLARSQQVAGRLNFDFELI